MQLIDQLLEHELGIGGDTLQQKMGMMVGSWKYKLLDMILVLIAIVP